MDISSILALIGTFGVILIGMFIAGQITMFVDPASVFIVIGGGIGAFFLSYPLDKCLKFLSVIKMVFTKQQLDVDEVRPVMVSFAEKARREGLLALEDDLQELDDEFLRKGIQLVVDGTDPELVEQIMRTELEQIDERHSFGSGAMVHMAGLFPALGMIGTLIGLVTMLAQMDNPDALGPAMAVALITTLYGAILANVVCAPMGERLSSKNNKELLQKELMIEGVLAIQAGENPRIVEEKLKAYLPESKISEEESGEE
ncbi:MAG: motility protein A [bacterium]